MPICLAGLASGVRWGSRRRYGSWRLSSGGPVHAAPYSPGRYIYAPGGNEAATRLSGISVNKVKIIVYALCGMLASLAGIIEVARLSSAQPTAGTGYELDAIAAVVLGGTSLAGGKGRIVGTLIGALILAS